MLFYVIVLIVVLSSAWFFIKYRGRFRKDAGPVFSHIRCPTCKIPLRYENKRIKILLKNGNEEILNLCFCDRCRQYYIDGYEDVFASEDSCKEWLYGPYTEKDMENFVNVLKKCPDPMDKYCKCQAHEFFYQRIYSGL
jgi:hypothetical protein